MDITRWYIIRQGQPVVGISPADGWADGAPQFGAGAVPSHILRLPADRLGQPPPPGRILVQQLQAFCHFPDPVFRQLRVPPQHVPASPIPKFAHPNSRFVRAEASRSPGDSASRTPQGSESNGSFGQSTSPTCSKPDPWPASVALASSHQNDATLIQIGCSSTWPLPCHWPGWYLGLSPGSTRLHAHPSGVPCQPPGTAEIATSGVCH